MGAVQLFKYASVSPGRSNKQQHVPDEACRVSYVGSMMHMVNGETSR